MEIREEVGYLDDDHDVHDNSVPTFEELNVRIRSITAFVLETGEADEAYIPTGQQVNAPPRPELRDDFSGDILLSTHERVLRNEHVPGREEEQVLNREEHVSRSEELVSNRGENVATGDDQLFSTQGPMEAMAQTSILPCPSANSNVQANTVELTSTANQVEPFVVEMIQRKLTPIVNNGEVSPPATSPRLSQMIVHTTINTESNRSQLERDNADELSTGRRDREHKQIDL